MSRPNDHHGGGRRGPLKPDHGENFVPGAEAAPENLAPQPLDHFKRGYKERADLRDREANPLPTEYDVQTKASTAASTPNFNAGYSNSNDNDGGNKNRRNFNGTGGGSIGFDVIRLVDELCRPGCPLPQALDRAKEHHFSSFASGKALTAILSNLARRRKLGIALSVWQWMDAADIKKNVFHYNSLISVCEKMKDSTRAMRLMNEMDEKGIPKNEVTFSSAISSCEKAGEWRTALDLLEKMKKEGITRTAIAYNAAISACEKGLVPHKALEIFEQMKREGVTPTVITYSAMISAAEKGQQWKLALEVLEEMKAVGHGANVIAYSAAISALSKGQMWEKALELFREIERFGNAPSIVTYNATMSALEKGLQWERALDLFDEMKMKGLPITVVSYGSAISACEKGLQYRQCLEFLDEMTEIGIRKNVVIFGAAMSCMEKSCRADIAFQLMDRMKIEGVPPNVHIFNSAISACARCNLWEKGYELFQEMEVVGVVKDVVSYNAVLDAVSTQVPLARRLFKEGVERGFYARVSRLGTQWLELDLHFLSLGGGEIALGWWFEECLVPYLVNSSKLAAVKSIDIVTGYGKTRMRGVRHGDDGMRKRVKAMLHFMEIAEVDQPNQGRIHIDKEALMQTVQRNGGKIIFDDEGYRKFKLESTTAAHIPDVIQNVRPKVKPAGPVGEMPRRHKDDDMHEYGRNSSRRGSYDDGRGRPGHGGSEDINWVSDQTSDHRKKYNRPGRHRQGGAEDNNWLSDQIRRPEEVGSNHHLPYNRPGRDGKGGADSDGYGNGFPHGTYTGRNVSKRPVEENYPGIRVSQTTSTRTPHSYSGTRDRFDNKRARNEEQPHYAERHYNEREAFSQTTRTAQPPSHSDTQDMVGDRDQRDGVRPPYDGAVTSYSDSHQRDQTTAHLRKSERERRGGGYHDETQEPNHGHGVGSGPYDYDTNIRHETGTSHFAKSRGASDYSAGPERSSSTIYLAHQNSSSNRSKSHSAGEKPLQHGRRETHNHISSHVGEDNAHDSYHHHWRSSVHSHHGNSSQHDEGKLVSNSVRQRSNEYQDMNQYPDNYYGGQSEVERGESRPRSRSRDRHYGHDQTGESRPFDNGGRGNLKLDHTDARNDATSNNIGPRRPERSGSFSERRNY